MFRIQPDLRFPRFKEPWKKIVLGDISKRPMYGVGASAVEFNNKDVYVRITDIEDKSRKLMSRNFTSPSIVNEKYLLKDKDILFARTGASTGKTYIHENYELKYDYYFAGFLIKFEILKSYYPDFIYQYTLTNSYENWVKVMSVRSGQPGINSEEYSKLKLNIPRYEEQKKIGDFFSKLDRQIELEEQKLEKLEEQKKGYMQQIFSQQLRFKDENGNEYPEWEEKKLGDILERGNKDKVNEIGKYRRLTISLHGKGLYEVKQERKTKDTRPFYQRFEGELIIGKQNFFNGSIAIVTREFNGFICSNAIMSYKISNHMNRKYLLEYLLQNDFLRKNEYLADGTGQKELSEKKFEELEIKLPNSINEQQKIGVFLERLDNLIEKQSNKLELLKQRKKSFLQKMFV